MDSALHELLRKNCDNSSENYTHITNYGSVRKWCVDDRNLENFWISYCNLVKDDKSSQRKLCLAEIPDKRPPVIVDLSLKFETTEDETVNYDVDFLLCIVYCYQQVIKKTLEVSESETELSCCIMEADPYKENGLTVHKIRLQFPYCKPLATVQNRIIRPLVLQMIRNKNIIGKLPSQPINEWEDIIDPLSVEKPIIMYGSSEKPNIPKFHLDYIVKGMSYDEAENQKANILDMNEFFRFHLHKNISTGLVNNGIYKYENDKNFWLPFFLSVNYYTGNIVTRQVPASGLKNSINMKSRIKTNRNSAEIDYDDDTNPEYLSDVFLNMLSMERVELDHYWIDVGKSLYGAFEGSERGLEKWVEFTETSDNHTPEECRRLYLSFSDSKLSIKTLAWYAKEDSPYEYNSWHNNWVITSLKLASSGLHSDVAEAVYRSYWLQFACGSLKKSCLYHFKNHVWKKLDDGYVLRKYFSKEFLTIIEKYRAFVSNEIVESQDERYKDSAEILLQKLGKLINKLKTRTFKNNLLNECLEKFYVENFERSLDSNENLMGMVNGIVETLDKKAIIRNGKPEDYLSRSTGLCWRHDLHEKHPLVLKLMDWLRKVFPTKELLNHFGKSAASCLRGKNSDKKFGVHSGCGNNSKSMIKKVFEAAFGEYCITFPTTVFTGKKSGGGPDPAIARSKFARVAFIQEPDPDTPIKTGTLKEMTGGDRFFARFLNDNGGEIEPMFKLILFCNTIPIIPHCDKAIKNRLVVIPYLSTWVKNPPKTMDERFRQRKFKMDKYFEQQIPELAAPFMWYLVKIYAKYRSEGLVEPEIVTKTTDDYWEENDIYSQFIKENIEKAYQMVPANWPENKPKPLDSKAKESLSEVYARFRDWHRENYGGLKLPDRQIVKGEMSTRIGKPVRNNFYGIKFKVEVMDF